ncbi:MAG: hypothetical protein SFV15_09680, partial [Polyangiaceae bacterium]|nr:hypothetical protein [Polyangiaceae bacterium]
MKTATATLLLGIVVGTASAGAALKGSDTLESMTKRVLATCPPSGISGISYIPAGDLEAEFAMASGQQNVAPMSRFFLDDDIACRGDSITQGKVEGMEIAGDSLSMLTSPAASSQCQGTVATGGLANNTTISLDGGGSYTFSGWKDVLRILFAGLDRTKPNLLAARDCNSNVRRSLQKNWSKLYQASCGAMPCTELKHLWTHGGRSDTTGSFIAVLGLPKPVRVGSNVTQTPFCGGLDYEDKDPIRIPCDANDDVCGADGTLGLLQTIFVPESLTTDVAYPLTACDPGV